LVRLLWKRKLWLVLPLLLSIAASVGLIKILPPVYRASTMILVESQKIPTEYVRSTITTTLNERLRTIEQQIKNRENLERIVIEMDLYPEHRGPVGMDRALKLVRRNLDLVVMGDQVFRIYFSGGDPQRVAETANRVAELFLNENLRRREDEAQNTTAFLEEELALTKSELESQEKRVAEFRIEHAGELPEDRVGNLQGISQLETRQEINLAQIGETELKILLLTRDLASLYDRGMVPGSPRSTKSRLDEAREELQRLTAQYTDRHPDVVRLRREIEQLKSTEGSPQSDLDVPLDPAQKEKAELAARIASLELELESLTQERDRILSELSSYQRSLRAIPQVQQELIQLTRDYENQQNSYQSLLGKRIEAKLAENLERKRQSEQFTILERAVPPSQPFAPNKLRILMLGSMLGAGLGFALILLREQTDQTYRDAQSLREAFPGVPYLGSVHRIEADEVASSEETSAVGSVGRGR